MQPVNLVEILTVAYNLGSAPKVGLYLLINKMIKESFDTQFTMETFNKLNRSYLKCMLQSNEMTSENKERLLRSNLFSNAEIIEILNYKMNRVELRNDGINIMKNMVTENFERAKSIILDPSIHSEYAENILSTQSDSLAQILDISYALYLKYPEKLDRFLSAMAEGCNENGAMALLIKIEERQPGTMANIFSNINVSQKCMAKILGSELMPPEKALNIFVIIYSSNLQMAIGILSEMAQAQISINRTHGSNTNSQNATLIFQSVASNCADAADIVFHEKFLPSSAAFFMEKHMSTKKIAEILRCAHGQGKVGKITEFLTLMIPNARTQSNLVRWGKVPKILSQLTPLEVDSIFNENLLRGLTQEIRAKMEEMRSSCAGIIWHFDVDMQHYDEEFIIRFQSSTAAVEQTENQSDNVSQSVTVDKEQIVSISSDGISPGTNVPDEKTPTVENKISNGEIPSGKEVYVDKILSAKSDTPALSHPGWLGKIFMGTVGKVLAAVAIIAGFGLVLWAVILWPLAACIGAGGAAAALAAAIFYQGRSTNQMKSAQVNLPPSKGNALPEVVDFQDICI
ncbi:MAG: hypothetical protein LBI69_00875 [Puniceicoccales bacterium]|jgi:hypothetical protein|nr:hypothetical protein [Puniceicoccales bacterium]